MADRCRDSVCLVLLVAFALSCARPIRTARLSVGEPETDAELEAQERGSACSPYWSFAFPGLGQACNRQGTKAVALGALGVLELGAGIAGAYVNRDREGNPDAGHPTSAVPILAFVDLYGYGVADAVLQQQLRKKLRYVPTDSTLDLVAAPFNVTVMKRPSVWVPLVLVSALLGAKVILDDSSGRGGTPNLFGRDVKPLLGYPVGIAAGASLYGHVAIAEEALFRGLAQSHFSRSFGETGGLLAASAIFGAAHAPNALAFEGKERKEYLLVGLPVITMIGTYLGWTYQSSGYSLAPPVALHFWYDLLLDTANMITDPQNNTFSAELSFSF